MSQNGAGRTRREMSFNLGGTLGVLAGVALIAVVLAFAAAFAVDMFGAACDFLSCLDH